MYAAIRYVERNPVVVGLVARAEQFPWSSACAHVNGTPDPLLTRHFIIERIPDWAAFLRSPQDEFAKQFARHEWTGRPFGERAFVERLEQLTGRRLHKRPPGKRRREAELSIVSPI